MLKPRKFLFVFFITLGIFGVAFLFSDYLFNTRVQQVKGIESTINQTILESEIQFQLLADAACEDRGANALLLEQLNILARRLEFLEEQRGADDAEVIALKKQYSLLEVKDYLLLRERARRCGDRPAAVLYFYSNEGECTDCKKMGYVLTGMREDYDDLHIYSFDFYLGLSAIETLKSIYHLEEQFPVVVIDRKPYYGFKDREELEALLPELAKKATSTASKAATTSAVER